MRSRRRHRALSVILSGSMSTLLQSTGLRRLVELECRRDRTAQHTAPSSKLSRWKTVWAATSDLRLSCSDTLAEAAFDAQQRGVSVVFGEEVKYCGSDNRPRDGR